MATTDDRLRTNTATVVSDFWDDQTVELSDTNVRKKVPKMPTITGEFQVVTGGGVETLAYLALQLTRTMDKKVVVRILASASAWFLGSTENMTGATSTPVRLSGLEPAQDPQIDPSTVLKTNFIDEEDITVGELLDLMDADPDEFGAYFGVMFLAANKRATRENRAAFNEKRQSAATASVFGDPNIFVPESPFLSLDVLNKVYAAMLSYSPVRTVLTARVVEFMERDHAGPSLAFMSMFALLNNSGMSALAIIKEATLKHQWVRHEFPELRPEFLAANEAMKLLKTVPARERPFIKAIHGNAFVPVIYTQIDNLTGVCKEILKRSTPSYQNYGGGRVTERQLAIINRHMDAEQVVEKAVTPE